MRISDWSSDVCSSDLFRLAAKPERERGNVGQLHRALDRRMAAKNLFDLRRSGARHAEDEDGVGCRIARSGARGKELWSAGGDDRVDGLARFGGAIAVLALPDRVSRGIVAEREIGRAHV